MKLQKNTRLALYSVLEFATDPDAPLSAAAKSPPSTACRRITSPRCCRELARVGVVESVRGVGGGYRFAGNARRLTLMDVIRMFEELSEPDGERREPGERTPVGQALAAVLSEIDEIADGDVQLDHARDDASVAGAAAAGRDRGAEGTRSPGETRGVTGP